MVAHWRRPAFELAAELLVGLAHVRVTHVHLAEEVVCQAPVVIQSAEVGAADVADLQLLVTGRTGGVLKVLEVALACFLLVFRGADLVHLVHGHCDGACLAENGDLEESGVDRVGEVGDLLKL